MSFKNITLYAFSMMLNYPDDYHIFITRGEEDIEDHYGWNGALSKYGKYHVVSVTLGHDDDGCISVDIEIDGGKE